MKRFKEFFQAQEGKLTKQFKKILSLVLVFSMLLGLVPINALAADTLVDAAIFCSDVHGSTSDLSSVFSGVKTSGVDYSTASFAGDTFSDTESSKSTVTSTAKSALGDTNIECYYIWGDHDSKSDIEDYTGLVYGEEDDGNYYIYALSMYSVHKDSDATEVEADLKAFTETVSGLDKTKPMFIVSHLPLHDRRGDNIYAQNWYEVISDAAESMDIVFFWAHNHTGETSADTDAYYVEKNGSETMTIEGGSTITPNFTYMNAGYINANGQNPARKGIATTVQIYKDSMVFQDYNSSGAYTGTYAHNVTVEREFAEEEITEQTFTFTDNTADVTVTAIASDAAITNVSGEVSTVDSLLEEDYVAYNVALTDYTEGNSVAITMSIPEDMSTANLKVYSVVDGKATEITEYKIVNGNISFTTTCVGTFVYGTEIINVSENAVLTSLEVTTPPAITEYFITGNSQETLALNITDLVVTGTFSDGDDTISKEIAWNEFGEVTDGYSLTFDMTKIGAQDVKVSYTYGDVTLTASFSITVCYETVEDENTNVTVHFDTPSVTKVSITENTSNANVQNAVDGLLTNYASYNFEFVGYTEGETVTVTLPIPDGVTNPGVYHVADDTYEATYVTGMKNNGDRTVTFTATKFSSYVVGESTEIVVPDATTATVTGATTTESKTVYVLVSTPTAGNQYLIVSANSVGNAYALKENTTTGSAVTIYAAGNGISAPYIETTDETIMWNAAFGMTFRSENGNYYLRQSNSGGSRSLSFTTSQSTNWTVGENTLSYKGQQNTYYVRYNSGWSLASSGSQNVYFYEKQTVTVTTSANGTYSIAGNPAEVEKIVINGSTVTLGSTLTFVQESGTTTKTDTSTTATYTVVSGGDPSSIISKIKGNTVTFTGNYGKALVKVSYTVTVNDTNYTVDNYIVVTAKEPTYSIDIIDGTTEESITDTIIVKGVTSERTDILSAVVTYEDADGTKEIAIDSSKLTWTSSDTSIATVDSNGNVAFTGNEGTVYITALYEYADGKSCVDTVAYSVSKSQYTIPSDGTNDFPEYPNEGAVRFDKTATAVGNFSETGIAQVELSMTGVPYTTGSEIDVVVMLDMTGSMSDDGMEAAEEATKAFVETIVKNEDGSYNSNRVAVYAFNSGSSSPYELVSFKSITSDAELETANTAIDTASDKQQSGGTPYDESLEKCYDVLRAAKTDGTGDNRQQFCVYMSDGGPTSYAGDDGDGTYTTITNSGSGTTAITTYLSGYSSSSSSSWSFTLPSEYYSNLMKSDGVTVYTVGLLLQTVPSNPSPYSSMTDSTYDSTTDSLTTIGSHYYFCSNILKQIASDDSKYIDIFNVDNADKATAAFTNIATSIKQAATNVKVTDKIADEYTMIFDIPTGVSSDDLPSGQEFYIEVSSYALDSDHNRSTKTSLMKLYLGQNEDSSYYAASDSNGTAYAEPTYETVADGEKGYYNLVDGSYVFVEDGTGTYNMVSGASLTGTNNDNIVIATPYFHYDASTRILIWTTEKLTTEELALSYFLYLNKSAGYEAEEQVDAGTYATNDWATLDYTNFNGNGCQQTFPVPQMTWNGAQVSYVFYLVNENGQPVNRAGRVVPFSEAVYVTDVISYAVLWNADGVSGELVAKYLAKDIVPDVYELYDTTAEYDVYVYETEDGENKNNHFVINGTKEVDTTYVFNTKADAQKYNEPGKYYAADVHTGFDFGNTTVAFAVMWKPQLETDTVVVDYGLPVVVNVAKNDALASGVVGVRKEAPANTVINSGQFTSTKATTADVAHGTVSVESLSSVRYTMTDTTITEPVVFYYESDVNYYDGDDLVTTSMYSSVTVIPATTVYYEDSFVEYSVYDKGESGWSINESVTWDTVGTMVNAVQAEDRPGDYSTLGIDANNVYGYDSAYESCATYSMGSARKINVTSSRYGLAEFEFYGTGFDVISLTSNTTGSIVVKVTDDGGTTKNYFVDTYYGYKYVETQEEVTDENNQTTTVKTGSWVVDTEVSDNSLYQIPVMKIEGLDYGHYSVQIKAAYNSMFDHQDAGSYEFYLDAIRIYNPAGTNTEAESAYKTDGEAYPSYFELRNLIIDEETFDSLEKDDVTGIVYIDGDSEVKDAQIADYEAYGPNNEIYVQPGDAIAFNLNMPEVAEIASIQIALKSIDDGTAYCKIWDAEATTADQTAAKTVATATDMYYEIIDLNGKTVVIMNDDSSDAILSITNIKVTYKEEATQTTNTFARISRASAIVAMASMYTVEEETTTPEVIVPETTVPDATTPEISGTTSEENVTDSTTDTTISETTEGTTNDNISDNVVTDDVVTESETESDNAEDTSVDSTEENTLSFFECIIAIVKNFFKLVADFLTGRL